LIPTGQQSGLRTRTAAIGKRFVVHADVKLADNRKRQVNKLRYCFHVFVFISFVEGVDCLSLRLRSQPAPRSPLFGFFLYKLSSHLVLRDSLAQVLENPPELEKIVSMVDH
jgi:hypothetical protein